MKNIILILALLVVISCRKKSESKDKGWPGCENITHNYISQPFKDFAFKQGSYWVYYDSLNATFYDTLHFEYYYSNNYEEGPKYAYGCDYYEFFRMRGWSKFMIEQTDRDYVIMPDSFVTVSSYQNSPKTVMFLPKGTLNNPCKFYDSLFIYDRYYKDVVQSDTIRGTNGITYKMLCFFNSQYGFLRNDLYNLNDQLISRKVLYSKYIIK